jgi:hypothetical protein
MTGNGPLLLGRYHFLQESRDTENALLQEPESGCLDREAKSGSTEVRWYKTDRTFGADCRIFPRRAA